MPNYRSWDAQHYKEHWAAYDVPRHLWHFSKKSIEQLFAKEGFHLLATHPMLFDAFYVSMLPNNTKQERNHFLKDSSTDSVLTTTVGAKENTHRRFTC